MRRKITSVHLPIEAMVVKPKYVPELDPAVIIRQPNAWDKIRDVVESRPFVLGLGIAYGILTPFAIWGIIWVLIPD